MRQILFLLSVLIGLNGFSQTLPDSRSVDWTLAGLRDTSTAGFIEIDMQAQGIVGDGQTPNDAVLNGILATLPSTGAILKFPAGNFLFNNTIELSNNLVLKGDGAEESMFTMDLEGSGHAFSIRGQSISGDTSAIVEPSAKDSEFMIVADASNFSNGDWIKTIQLDSDLVTSSWAVGTIGQITRVRSVSNDTIFLASPLRMNYDIAREPHIVKIIPAENIGLECLKILRIDDTAPQQSSNIYYAYAVNCWISGIESENCTFSHIQTNFSSNLQVSKSYFHHAFGYGGGGRAYGVMLQLTSNECLVEDNIFEHLRHSMIVQAGANGNVFSYNYSFDPFWESTPSNTAGDVVLHGNFVYANLFEQNICQNIVIDNSHGPNGPFNTMLRNRAEGYGIFFSATNSPEQNFLGNEITNRGFPFSFVNYTIQGDGHFIYGNDNKGIIDPPGSEMLLDKSYAYTQRPIFIPQRQWAGIGTPNATKSNSIPAADRLVSRELFTNTCGNATVSSSQNVADKDDLKIFPNPVEAVLTIQSVRDIQKISISDAKGIVIHYQENVGLSNRLSTINWADGIYFVTIEFKNNTSVTKAIVKAK
jgi:hypothetical protein